ncbi:hypothetical protein HYH03_012994 [Edaphochlamys debaryana]|uniref:Steroid 5-alpha reductase C-terminal domain-containing protein n=1 Tax=Edaphochlamys debaryana TaxID=47281 RepID=A0A835XRS5_9CHLO|nr:hypothetical protein HYH03_012994 [Edaphochlamys debaryana]|eukprot:KAG2488490.1 hypothetical protein HYH03_012994 [Edaphochlamys debaryana]
MNAFELVSRRFRLAALNLSRRFAKQGPEGPTGVNLIARGAKVTLLGRRLLQRGPLLGAGGVAAFGMLPGPASAAAGSGSGLGSSAALAGLAGFASLSLPGSFAEMGLLGWLGVDLAINWGGWAVAAALKTEKFYDMLGTGSFLALTAGSLAVGGASGARKLLVSGMVGVWALRLGAYLVDRVHRTGKDARFDEIKHKPGTFLVAWTAQAVWVFLTSLPVLIINGMPSTRPLGPIDAIGITVWAVGFLTEVVADRQKAVFKAKPENKGRFIDEGLWSLSRHPNYFGEMMLWWGVFLTCAPGFSSPWHLASVVSPVFTFLLIRFVSGVPLLEKMGEQRWGQEPAFQEYKARTNMLLPLPRFKDTHTS